MSWSKKKKKEFCGCDDKYEDEKKKSVILENVMDGWN